MAGERPLYDRTPSSQQSSSNSANASANASTIANRVPSFRTFIRNLPTPQSPPDHSNAAIKTLRRSSSVYSRATRMWSQLPDLGDGEITPTMPRASWMRSRSSSHTGITSPHEVSPLTPELEQQIPSTLEARTYRPFPASISPSLKPYARRASSAVSFSQLLSEISRKQDAPSWSHARHDEIHLSPSPPPLTPVADNTDYSFEASLAAKHYDPYQIASPDVSTGPRLTRPFETPPTDHWRQDSVGSALSHMRLGSDISTPETRSMAPSSDSQAYPQNSRSHSIDSQAPSARSQANDYQSTTSDDVLSAEYQDQLVAEYRDLLSSSSAPVHDNISLSDLEPGNELQIVPAPLFWENRKRELYPNRVGHAQRRTQVRDQGTGQAPGLKRYVARAPNLRPARKQHQKQISLSDAPLKMVLPSKYGRDTANPLSQDNPDTKIQQDDSPTTTSLKKALALRQKGNRKDDDADDAQKLQHAKKSSKPLQGRLPLRLPKIAYGDAGKVRIESPPLTARRTESPYGARSCEREPSTEQHDKTSKLARLGFPTQTSLPESPGLGHKGAAKLSIASAFHRRIPSGSSRKERERERERERAKERERPRPKHSVMETPHNRHPSAISSPSPNLSLQIPASTTHHISPNQISAFSPVDEEDETEDEGRRSFMPGMGMKVFGKAREARKEREARRRRRELKSQIRFVGRVDPGSLGESEADGTAAVRARRDTFGEGWI